MNQGNSHMRRIRNMLSYCYQGGRPVRKAGMVALRVDPGRAGEKRQDGYLAGLSGQGG